MKEIDLMSIGSYTELPGGNIALPQGYSSVLSPIIKNIPPENILKQHPITSIQWRWGEDKEEEEVSDAESDCSVNTVKSVEREEALLRLRNLNLMGTAQAVAGGGGQGPSCFP